MATERIFLPLFADGAAPRWLTITCPPRGCFHNLVFVSIKKEHPGQAYKVMKRPVGARAR